MKLKKLIKKIKRLFGEISYMGFSSTPISAQMQKEKGDKILNNEKEIIETYGEGEFIEK